jgi:enoyl-CoA hydratase
VTASVYVAEDARIGFANRAFPADALEGQVVAIAERIARVPPELQALAFHQRVSLDYRQELKAGVTRALGKRDAPFGDYRTSREETS